jgi:hypothetical protein
MENIQKENKTLFTIIGQLVSADLKEGTYKSGPNAGKGFISGSIVVKSTLDNEPNLFEIELFQNEQTKTGEVNKLYTAYKGLNTMINTMVQVDGAINENRYFNKKTGTISSSNRLDGRYVSKAQPGKVDSAVFEVSGFVNRELVEKTNKKGEVYTYEMELGQRLQSVKKPGQIMRFHIDPAQAEIIRHIESSYTIGTTVSFYGNIRFVTRTQTYEQSGVAFGEARVKTSTIVNRNFFITGGNEPLDGDTAYEPEEIQAVAKAIAAKDVEMSNAGGGETTTTAAPISRAKAVKII